MNGDLDAVRRDEDAIVSAVRRVFPNLERRGPARYRVPAGAEGDSLSVYCLGGVWRYARFSDRDDRGDVFDFVQRYYGVPGLAEAVRVVRDLGLAPTRVRETRAERRADWPRRPPRWAASAESWVRRYEAHPGRYALWRAYKPLSRGSIERWRLGVGVLPPVWTDDRTGEVKHAADCGHERLVYPVYQDGRIVALRGRAIACGCAKWLNAAGSVAALWGAELLPGARGRHLIVCENPVDAMLAVQIRPDLAAVAPNSGAGVWRPEWSAAIGSAGPSGVTVAYDHDMAGNCGRDHCRVCLDAYRAWLAKMRERAAERWRELGRSGSPPDPVPPRPNGPRVANLLIGAGCRSASVWPWPAGAPYGRDLGDEIASWLDGRTDRLTIA